MPKKQSIKTYLSLQDCKISKFCEEKLAYFRTFKDKLKHTKSTELVVEGLQPLSDL